MEAPKRIVLDTSVIVRHMRGKDPRLVGSLQEKADLATTMINGFELYHGAYLSKETGRNLQAVKGFLATIDILTLDDASSEKSGKVLAQLEREGRTIDPRDLFIGCIALQSGFAVLTDNRRHFERIPELLVISPTELKP